METHYVTSDNKDTAYTATVILFNNVSHLACSNIAGWKLSESYTNNSDGEFITEYQNGKMFIRAHTVNGYHAYTFGGLEEK